MPHTLLPLECWELVIDACNDDSVPRWWSLVFANRRENRTYLTLRSCALTCKAFHPRSRLNLLRSVELSAETQVDLLIRTLTQQPHLADLVTGVFQFPSSWSGGPEKPNKYVPLARSPLPSLLRNCQSLAFLLDNTLHHANYIHALAAFAHITRLSIYISGHTISTLLHTIWSYPEIVELLLDISYSTNWGTISESYGRRLSEMRPATACRNLKTLTILNTLPINIPLGVFGNTISNLVLGGLDENHDDNIYWTFLSGFLCLRSLRLEFVERRILATQSSRSQLELDEVQKLSAVQRCLSNVRAYATLRSVELRPGITSYLPSFHSAKELASLGALQLFYFVVARQKALELLFGGHIGDLLRRFPQLYNYSVELYDSPDREGWWIDRIKTRMPCMVPVMRGVRLEPLGRTGSLALEPRLGGWLEDVPPNTTSMTSSEKKDELAEESTVRSAATAQ